MSRPNRPPEGEAAARRSAPPTVPRRSTVERAVISLGVIGTMIALLSASAVAWSFDKWSSITEFDFGDDVGEVASGEPANWLLVGSDSREGIDEDDPNAGVILGEGAPDGKRTDTIIVARIDPNAGVVHLLSIPRDLYVTYSDGQVGRINGAFSGDNGEQRLLETVEQTLNIDINHYAEINFAGFQDIVDNLGGVNIWFDRPMRDPASGLDISSAGCHSLTGSQALAFARSRHLEYFDSGGWRVDGSGDLGRNSRQQYFIRRVASTAISKLDITELGTINRLLDAGGTNLTRDQTIGPDDLLGLASTFASVSDDQIIGHALPVFDYRADSGAAVLGLQIESAQSVLAVFRGEEPPTDVVSPFEVVVFNGNRVLGGATDVADQLDAHGLDAPNVDNAPTTDRSVLRYGPGYEDEAALVASYLVATPAYQLDPDLGAVVELVLGTDFQGVRASARENQAVPTTSGATPTTTNTTVSNDEVAPTTVVPAAPTQSTIGIVPGPTPVGTACE